jgi:S-adenosylmethionine:tRNA ribosyltransferase-isomerase
MPERSKINLKEFHYSLPKHRIAQFPLKNRDGSKLLIYRDKQISEDRFKNVHQHLPDDSLLIYNETRVVHARLQFQKESGANIEIFCLEPVAPVREIQQAFEQRSGVIWKCLVGNSKKWKDGELAKYFKLNRQECKLRAKRGIKKDESSNIEFFWEPAGLSFSEILEHAGIIPLPPYMKRETIESDKTRYQTIYARAEGSVAAPTAGLHFTDDVFSKLKKKNISTHDVTLHVGAGTFKPISSETIEGHEMHTEQIRIKKQIYIYILLYIKFIIDENR